jgi:hypothetical protein
MDNPSPKAVRRKGLIRFAAGLAVFGIGIAFTLFLLPRINEQLSPKGLMLFAFPGAYALAGIIEIITGVPFVEFARRWDQLKGWQRGVFGTAIVLLAGFIIISGFAFFASF